MDAGHGNFYACGYFGTQVSIPPLFASREQVDAIIASGYVPVAHTPLFEGVRVADAAQGLLAAAVNKAGEVMPAHALEALYLRKSSAEEGR